MNPSIDDNVRDFVLSELPLVTTLLLKKISVADDAILQELHEADDLAEMAEKYFAHFSVQPAGFSLANYYPWKRATQNKKPLTINMFIESARAGYWMYR